jgi:hypothetical protein
LSLVKNNAGAAILSSPRVVVRLGDRRDVSPDPRDDTGGLYVGKRADSRFFDVGGRTQLTIRRNRRDARAGPAVEKPWKKAEIARTNWSGHAQKCPLVMQRIRGTFAVLLD